MNLLQKINENVPIIFVILMIIIQIYKNKKYIELLNLFKNIRWLIHFIILIIFLIYIRFFNANNIDLINASKKAILALVIAIFAYLDMTIAPFWIVFVLAYFGKDYI